MDVASETIGGKLLLQHTVLRLTMEGRQRGSCSANQFWYYELLKKINKNFPNARGIESDSMLE